MTELTKIVVLATVLVPTDDVATLEEVAEAARDGLAERGYFVKSSDAEVAS